MAWWCGQTLREQRNTWAEIGLPRGEHVKAKWRMWGFMRLPNQKRHWSRLRGDGNKDLTDI